MLRNSIELFEVSHPPYLVQTELSNADQDNEIYPLVYLSQWIDFAALQADQFGFIRGRKVICLIL